ncbi:MAG TPA: GNAT family N-acetyltransferase [Thermofilum sp.]|nr:GNAT family N-acetyltransferase [Thermofilum sp.]
MRLSVREARREDLRDILEIINRSFNEWDKHWAVQGLNHTKVFIAETEERNLAGFVETYVTRVEKVGKIGVIYYIAVKPEYRHKGVGRSLVFKAEEYFRLRKAIFSTASTKYDNLASRLLFKSMGYKELLVTHNPGPVVERLIKALYAYEDDIIFYKRL